MFHTTGANECRLVYVDALAQVDTAEEHPSSSRSLCTKRCLGIWLPPISSTHTTKEGKNTLDRSAVHRKTHTNTPALGQCGAVPHQDSLVDSIELGGNAENDNGIMDNG